MQYVIIISWEWEEGEESPWVYGPYETEPTEAEQKAARQEFMKETTTSEGDWETYGCEMWTAPLINPPQMENSVHS